MSKKSEIGNEVANNMSEILGNDKFTSIFHPVVKTASVKEAVINTDAVSDYTSFEKFVSLAKKKDKKDEDADKDDDKEDKKSDKKKDDKDSDKDDKKKDKKEDSDKGDKKDKKKGKKKGFPFWLKKKKASDKCNCSEDCSCKTGKCDCEGCKDCAACGDKMYASAIKYMVETLTRTSAALDNMGLEKSSVAVLATLDHIIDEAAKNKFASEDDMDENDVRGMDLLLGLDDDEALEGFEDEELDDPNSTKALEEIFTQNPKLVDDIAPNLKAKFDVENQLKDRVKSRLQNVMDTAGNESDIEELKEIDELAGSPLPKDEGSAGDSFDDFMYDKPSDGPVTIPVPEDKELPAINDFMNVDDAEVIKAYKELNDWVKSAETVDGDDFDKMLASYIGA